MRFAAFEPPAEAIAGLDRRFLDHLRRHGPARKRLQQRMWRIPAEMFDAAPPRA